MRSSRRKATAALVAVLALPFSLMFPPTVPDQSPGGALLAILEPSAAPLGDTQATFYSIAGRVLDGSGNGVPDATVTATSDATAGQSGFSLYLPALLHEQSPGGEQASAAGAAPGPVANGSVAAQPVYTTTTSADGAYRFDGLQAGTYTVVAARAGYTIQPASQLVTVPGSESEIRFNAAPITGGTPTPTPTPTPIPSISYSQVAVGDLHTCALTTAGGVKCWGNNGRGQLGDGTTTPRLVPTDVSGLTSGVQAIAAGGEHTCALTTAGGVKCWGYNSFGQLGDGTTTNHATPADVSGLTSGVQAIEAGYYHTCALMIAGGVKCWGFNAYGQIGDGTTTTRRVPTDVSGLVGGVQAIAAGGYHTCALTTAGGAKCWGYNASGQVGDGTTTPRSAPTDVSGLNSGVQAIDAGDAHTCALTTAGGVKCWGYNSDGELGDGTTTSRVAPVDVSGLTSGVQVVVAGGYHTCVLTTAGGVKCWGDNNSGQVGDGTTTNRLAPTGVSGLTSGVQTLGAGGRHTCALTAGGAKCWGDNSHGELGDGTMAYRFVATDVPGLTGSIKAIAAGSYDTCALTAAGGAKCWGYNGSGQLGDGTAASRLTPADVSSLTSGVQVIVAGSYHTCALTMAGGVKCWGDGGYGQLGDGTTTFHLTAADVSGLTSGVQAIAAAGSHTCALTTAGGVKCWGYNSFGQLGDGTKTNRLTPTDVSGLASGVQAIATNFAHACVLTTAGGVKCWGYNGKGQLGDGSGTDRLTPVDVSGLTSGVKAIAVGGYHTCALTTAGRVMCWGDNSSGQLGDGTANASLTPTEVTGLTSGVQAIAAGETHTCAVTTAGGVKCWGDNTSAQLGDGTTISRLAPVDVSGLASGAQVIAIGDLHACAVIAAGGVKCWGDNTYGQLGVNPGWTPVDVVAGN